MSPSSKEKIIEVLKGYFEDKDEVLLAFLFGSVSRVHYGVLSDIDVAVYLKNGVNEIKIWCEIERLLKEEVDMLVLNQANPILAWEAIKGIPLTVKDRGLYLDLILELSWEAEDLIKRNIDMWNLKEEINASLKKSRYRADYKDY